MVEQKTEQQIPEEKKEQPKEELSKAVPEAPKAVQEAATVPSGEVTTPPKEEVTTPEPAKDKIAELEKRIEQLEKMNSSLSAEKGKSETKAMVDSLINSGVLSEAKREAATTALVALSSDEAKTAFLSVIGNGNWKSTEQGLVLSEEKKQDKLIEFSEPARNVIT